MQDRGVVPDWPRCREIARSEATSEGCKSGMAEEPGNTYMSCR
jgi:hypothetical protein